MFVNPTAPLGRAPVGPERQHYREDGLSKMGWPRKSDAKRASRHSMRTAHLYRCPFCRLWHHGTSKWNAVGVAAPDQVRRPVTERE